MLSLPIWHHLTTRMSFFRFQNTIWKTWENTVIWLFIIEYWRYHIFLFALLCLSQMSSCSRKRQRPAQHSGDATETHTNSIQNTEGHEKTKFTTFNLKYSFTISFCVMKDTYYVNGIVVELISTAPLNLDGWNPVWATMTSRASLNVTFEAFVDSNCLLIA